MPDQDPFDAYTANDTYGYEDSSEDGSRTVRRKRTRKRRAETREFLRSIRDAEQRQEDDNQPSDLTILAVASLTVIALLQYPRWFPVANSSTRDISAESLTLGHTPMSTTPEAVSTTGALTSCQSVTNSFESCSAAVPTDGVAEAAHASEHAVKQAIKGLLSGLRGDPVSVDESTSQGGAGEDQEGASR